MFKYDSLVMGITDRDVIHRLIHPSVFHKLGINSVTCDASGVTCLTEAGAMETVSPVVTLSNDIERREFFFANGRMTIERDGLEVLAEVFWRPQGAAPEQERKVLRCALRDRQLDGTTEASPLSAFPNTHEATNKLPHPDFKAAELSIYCYDPEHYLPQSEMLDFIMNLDRHIYKDFEPEQFFRLWSRAFEASNMAPWQPAPPLKGVAQHFVEAAGDVLTERGYHRMDAVAGWFNVVLFFIERMGFTFTYGEHRAAFDALQAGLRKVETGIGRRLNAREQAWVVALQNVPAKFIPEQLCLGARWINTPTYTDYVCRIHRDLNPFLEDPRKSRLTLPAVFAAVAQPVAGECRPGPAQNGPKT